MEKQDKTPNPRRQAAGRLNGLRSKGRKSPEGRARSAQNALKHGLTCAQPKLLKHEDEPAYRILRKHFIDYLQPKDPFELLLIESIVEAKWQVQRAEDMELKLLNAEIAVLEIEIAEHNVTPKPEIEAIQVGAWRGATHRDKTMATLHKAKVVAERNFHRRINTFLKLRNQTPNELLPGNEETTQISEPPPPPAPTPAATAKQTPITFYDNQYFSYKTKVSIPRPEPAEPIPKQPLKAMTAA
jgi:hypothetical protein